MYAFFDYDGEPIYVGQTIEVLRGRVGRHLTGRRLDAVGKFVLDPFEVLELEVWPTFGRYRSQNAEHWQARWSTPSSRSALAGLVGGGPQQEEESRLRTR